MIKSNKKYQKGQTLIEAVVALAVALVIIGSVVTLVNASNRRANIARQTTQGSKLAQQGMEIVRNIRDVDEETVKVGRNSSGSCGGASPCSWSELYENTQPGGAPACFSLSSITNQWELLDPTNASCEGALINNVFTREVLIEDDVAIDTDEPPDGFADSICAGEPGPPSVPASTHADVKRITVTVTWQSPTGQTTKTAMSCITSWR